MKRRLVLLAAMVGATTVFLVDLLPQPWSTMLGAVALGAAGWFAIE